MAVLYKCYFGLPPTQKICEAIMDDLILFTPLKESHMNKGGHIEGFIKEQIEDIA